MKIILFKILAINALYMEREMVNYTTTESLVETTTEASCDWSWAKRHAFALAGFIFGLIFFPICMRCCGFSPSGVIGDSCASGAQR